jgi:hypothetical protein
MTPNDQNNAKFDEPTDAEETASGQAAQEKKTGKTTTTKLTKCLAVMAQELQQLREEVRQRRFQQSGAELYGFLSQGDENNALRLLEGPNPPDVQFCDVGGMNMLHRAARMASPKLISRLMELRVDPNQTTLATRAPGLGTPLMCLAEVDWNKLDTSAALATCGALASRMGLSGLCQQNTKQNTWAHIAASRGNVQMLEEVLTAAQKRFGAQAI